jgi:hypothetical protein
VNTHSCTRSAQRMCPCVHSCACVSVWACASVHARLVTRVWTTCNRQREAHSPQHTQHTTDNVRHATGTAPLECVSTASARRLSSAHSPLRLQPLRLGAVIRP